ncbi:MAG: HdeD family acid-resistance protein [Bacteroidota bacterium]
MTFLKRWWPTAVVGVFSIIFGLIAILFPEITLFALAIYFAISFLLGGLTMIIGSFSMKQRSKYWALLLLEGIIGVLIGIFILLRPEISIQVFLAIVGIWAIIMGIILGVAYYLIRKAIYGAEILIVFSILSLVFGILILTNPFESSRIIIIIIGLYAILYGIFSLINSARISKGYRK